MRRLLITLSSSGRGCNSCEHLVIEGSLATVGRCRLFAVGVAQRANGEFERVTGCLNAERLAAEGAPAA